MDSITVCHLFKNLGLLFLSLLFFPINSLVVLVAYGWHSISGNGGYEGNKSKEQAKNRQTVLVTGMNMSKGLSLARMFHQRGHRVIGADWHSRSIGSVSRALDKYYRLPPPSISDDGVNVNYIDAFLRIIADEGVALWVSVSDVTAAVADAAVKEIAEKRTGVKCIQPSIREIEVLHEKSTFIEHTKHLGLPVPVTEVVKDKQEAVDFLQRHGGLCLVPGAKQYLVKPIGVNDAARFDMALLPLSSEVETLNRLNSIPFDEPGSSYIIQEFIRGHEFCTHSVVIRGEVRAFVACPSTDVLTHYAALAIDSPLSTVMLAFTAKQAASFGPSFTGHLSFDFLVDRDRECGKKSLGQEPLRVYPIECNPRVHTATVLFEKDLQLVDEYLSVLSPYAANDNEIRPPLSPTNPGCHYWICQDIVELVLHPLYLACWQRTISFGEFWISLREFLYYLRHGQDGVFRAWDPLPFWWTCHVYWPAQFLLHLVYGPWVKINVSTGKIFQEQ